MGLWRILMKPTKVFSSHFLFFIFSTVHVLITKVLSFKIEHFSVKTYLGKPGFVFQDCITKVSPLTLYSPHPYRTLLRNL